MAVVQHSVITNVNIPDFVIEEEAKTFEDYERITHQSAMDAIDYVNQLASPNKAYIRHITRIVYMRYSGIKYGDGGV